MPPKPIPTPPKICVICGRNFRRVRTSLRRFAKQRCCGRACSNELLSRERTTPTPGKVCLGCGGTFYRRRREGVKEFHERKHCRDSCYKPGWSDEEYERLEEMRLSGIGVKQAARRFGRSVECVKSACRRRDIRGIRQSILDWLAVLTEPHETAEVAIRLDVHKATVRKARKTLTALGYEVYHPTPCGNRAHGKRSANGDGHHLPRLQARKRSPGRRKEREGR